MKALILLLFATPLLADDVKTLNDIHGYWTTNKWGEHQLCIFVGSKIDKAESFRCFPIPKRVGKQIPA